jgi:hypothetical protein
MPSGYLQKFSGFQKAILSIVILFIIFNLSLLIITFLTDENDLRQMVKMARYISYMKYVIIINMILFTTIILIYQLKVMNLKKAGKQHEDNNIRLKSTLYDTEKEKSDVLQG